jgi:hypothetical protein
LSIAQVPSPLTGEVPITQVGLVAVPLQGDAGRQQPFS